MIEGKNVVVRTVVVGSFRGSDGFKVVSMRGGVVVVGKNVLVVGGRVVVFLVTCENTSLDTCGY